MPTPLLLADTPWLLYRSFFALPKSITDGEGRPVNALLGTVNAILALIEPPTRSAAAALREAGIAEPPRAVVACTGAEQAVYRVELYEPYHAHRDPMPPELAEQWQRAPALLEALGWIVSGSDTLEADDLMFSFAQQEAQTGGRALLLTGDRDLYGAVGEQVAVVETGKGGAVGLIGPDEVVERYGIPPELVPDFIALRGDPSDGLPGAPGIGAKTAAELLRRYGPLEQLLDAAEQAATQVRRDPADMRPRTVASLRENAGLLRRFKEIATLQHVDLPSPASSPTDFERGAEVAAEMGMRRLSERLRKVAAG